MFNKKLKLEIERLNEEIRVMGNKLGNEFILRQQIIERYNYLSRKNWELSAELKSASIEIERLRNEK